MQSEQLQKTGTNSMTSLQQLQKAYADSDTDSIGSNSPSIEETVANSAMSLQQLQVAGADSGTFFEQLEEIGVNSDMSTQQSQITGADSALSLEQLQETGTNVAMSFSASSSQQEAYTDSDSENRPNIHDCFNCEICKNYDKHVNRYTVARIKYQQDRDNMPANQYIYTVDMQKILILPKMNIKNAYFVSRLVVMHETFAALHNGKNLCIVWHEATAGRSAPEVCSSYYNVIISSPPTITRFVFWTDNCSAQNKNWVLLTTFSIIVNEEWGPESICIKYFEPGHTYMKSDAVHGKIGAAWNRTESILDINDLITLINSSEKANEVTLLSANN